MNNYEHIISGGIDALMDYGEKREENCCPICALDGEVECDTINCVKGMRQWLEAEYAEPDSQEKIDADAKMRDYEYALHNGWYNGTDDIDVHCFQQRMTFDLLSRQRRLDGVE